ncbi:MAG TPA: ABC transporter ATP-binding protein [Micropepsaceae bacterium]|nr:ABC transporter ATP-binding protein [Micropepsaceae bacterium]
MTTLEALRVSVKRGGRAILDDVSLRAEGGSFVAVIGPNGAGKSTLLMTLAGLMRSDSGSITINDRPLTAFSSLELARTRSYLPQNPRCEWPIPVASLVALGLTPTLPLFGDLPEAHRRRVAEVLAAFDLLDRSGQAATTLSGGELTRAMLARALVGDPDILIVDEPVAGLDPRHTLDTVRRLAELAKSGKLVIAAVHDLTLAARYATRILALNHGRVAADGPPDRMLDTDLLRSVFQVEARIGGVAGGAFVDYLAPTGERS